MPKCVAQGHFRCRLLCFKVIIAGKHTGFLDYNQIISRNTEKWNDFCKNSNKMRTARKPRTERNCTRFFLFENLPNQSGKIVVGGFGAADHLDGAVLLFQQLFIEPLYLQRGIARASGQSYQRIDSCGGGLCRDSFPSFDSVYQAAAGASGLPPLSYPQAAGSTAKLTGSTNTRLFFGKEFL